MTESDVLWTSDNPAYGVVRRVLFCGDYAAQFDDLNGDLREVCLTIFERGAAGWEAGYSQDDVGYLADEADSASYGLSGGLQVWAYGRARPRARARIELYGGEWTVNVDADGWWLLVADAPKRALKKALKAEDERWQAFRKHAFGSTSSDWSGGGIHVWTDGDAPAGLADLHRSHLRVTIE